MARIQPVDPATATGRTKELLDEAKKKLGAVPNLLKTFAHSPAALEAYLAFSGALGKASLPARSREAIALAVGEVNGCDYCVAAHTMLGKRAGLSDDEAMAARRAESADRKTAAVLRLAVAIVETKGFVPDETLAAARSAGLSDGEIAEVVATVALNVYTNYFNHVAGTAVDFPRVPDLAAR